jgi:phage terminase large subunit
MFIRTTAINKILKLTKFIRGVQGGTSAGKTYAILPILINIAAKNKQIDISVVSESIPHLKRGCIKDFKKIMVDTGRWVDSRWNASDFKYNFANGSQIEFFSADSDAKLRGARRDWLYMNECNNIVFNAYNELAMRTKNGIFLDWNPTNSFWFHTELQQDNNVDFITINYLDNEACPDSAKEFIINAKRKAETSTFWANWYKVYGLGEIGSLQGTIFDFLQCDDIPTQAQLIAYGIDFGFTNDPTAMVAVYKCDKELYIDELIYQTQLTNQQIVQRFNELGIKKEYQIIADSAEPKSIAELRIGGYSSTMPAKKGPDSIKASINLLQNYTLNVTSRSTNIIRELRNYRWDEDKDGKQLNTPIDKFNHSIDAIRYVALNKINKVTGVYTIG